MTTTTTTISKKKSIITLYHVPRTISSPIYQCLLELNLVVGNGGDDDTNVDENSNDMIRVETMNFADLKSSTHLERNPMGTSPTLQVQEISVNRNEEEEEEENDDSSTDFIIWESGAVLSYLLETYDDEYKLHLNPVTCSRKQLASYLHIQQYVLTTIYPFLATLYVHTVRPMSQQDPTYIENAKSKFRTLLGPTLAGFLGSNDYLMGGSEPTAIDFLLVKPLTNAYSLGLIGDEKEEGSKDELFPTLTALLRRIQSRPSYCVAYNYHHQCPNDDDQFHCNNSRSIHVIPGNVGVSTPPTTKVPTTTTTTTMATMATMAKRSTMTRMTTMNLIAIVDRFM